MQPILTILKLSTATEMAHLMLPMQTSPISNDIEYNLRSKYMAIALKRLSSIFVINQVFLMELPSNLRQLLQCIGRDIDSTNQKLDTKNNIVSQTGMNIKKQQTMRT